MSTKTLGILTIVFATICCLYSWLQQRRDHYTMSILLLMLGGLALRLFTAADFFLHPWDEAFHALAARHMMQHPLMPTLYESPALPYDYRNWGSNHIWLHKQPLPLWAMAASMYLFGVNEIALRLPSVILTTIGIWLTFYAGSYFFDRRTGYLAAFFYSVNGLIIETSAGRVATDHIDIFFLFFVELAIVFSIVFSRRRHVIYTVLTGIALGCAILSKWLPALIVLPMWLLIVIDSGGFTVREIVFHFILLCAVTLSIFLPWQLYIYHTFPVEARWEAGYNLKHITRVLDKQGGPIYYYLNKIRINYGELVYLPMIWFVWRISPQTPKGGFNSLQTNVLKPPLGVWGPVLKPPLGVWGPAVWALFIWFFIPMIFFSLLRTKMQGYILFAAPAIFIISAAFWFWLLDYQKDLKERKTKKPAIWLIYLLLIAFIALPIRYCIERMKPVRMDRSPQWVADLKELDQKKIPNAVLFNYPKPIDAMFYTGLTVYADIPDTAVIHDLQRRGYTILINDDGNKVPAAIMSVNGVSWLHLSDPYR